VASREVVAPGGDGIVLTHGASSNARAPLLVALADAFGARGLTVFRYDLPFRQARPTGPPAPGGAARDREGLRGAVEAVRASAPGRVFLGGHSYGGRQASILAAGEPGLANALLLLSYPLHPPGRAGEPRTAHFPGLGTPALFVHGWAERMWSLYRRAELPPKIVLLTSPSAGPSGAKLCFFCMSSGISRRRSASICHWGDPYHTESLPQTTWSAPIPLTSVPMNAAAK